LPASINKKIEPARNPRRSRYVMWIIFAMLLIIGSAAWYMTYLSDNKASDLAAPLEKSLVANGAAKQCDTGSPGHGPDTTSAWHRAYYDVRLSEDDAVTLVNRVAKDNGYNLTHASPTNRGHLGAVADVHIDKWYFDDSKPQPYSDIEAGNIELAFTVDGPGSSNGCKTDSVTQAGHAMIGIDIQLPNFKH